MKELDLEQPKIKFAHCGEIRTIGKIEPMKFDLKVLENNLLVCKIKISTPDNPQHYVECQGLIDTGSERSIICKSVFDQLETDTLKIRKAGISTLAGNNDDLIIYPLHICVPYNNWICSSCYIGVSDFMDREEYKAIIGMDILRRHTLVYHGTLRQAWIQTV